MEDAVERALRRLSDAQVEALAVACARHEGPGAAALTDVVVGGPVTSVAAVAQLTEAWARDPAVSGAGVALALRVGLSGRQRMEARRARPVWTGPTAIGEQALTASTLHELIANARERERAGARTPRQLRRAHPAGSGR